MKRYHIRNDCDCNTCLIEYDLPDGDYVRYEDAQARIDELEDKIIENWTDDVTDLYFFMNEKYTVGQLKARLAQEQE